MKNTIEQYLQTQSYIKFRITRDELSSGKTQRYFDLLSYVGQHPDYARKFCGKFTFAFPEYASAELWREAPIRQFVHRLNAVFPFLFFLAEKEQETLKLLTLLECATGEAQGENFALDQKRFAAYLKAQLTGLIHMAQWTELPPDRAQLMIKEIYTYFGL